MTSFFSRQTVLSGIRATGKLHLGTYLGVLERFAKMSQDIELACFFFIADLHTLTTFREAEQIRAHAPDIVLDMLAAGVNPECATIYAQSHVPCVTELAWYLACLASVGDLERMPTYRDKVEKQPDDVNAGLFTYPVLMAADILGPRANLVPVGHDQQPHLEFTRDLARRFNLRYGEYFPIPDGLTDESISVPGLVAMDREGRFTKMGKSESASATLFLGEGSAAREEKIRRAPTDPARVRRNDPGTPERCAIFQLHGLLSSTEEIRAAAVGCHAGSIACVECKQVLAGNIEARLMEFTERRAALAGNPETVRDVLAAGAERAQRVFAETTETVAERMGVRWMPRVSTPSTGS